MQVVLHDKEDVLRGGEAAVAAFPLLPALRAQLVEVVDSPGNQRVVDVLIVLLKLSHRP